MKFRGVGAKSSDHLDGHKKSHHAAIQTKPRLHEGEAHHHGHQTNGDAADEVGDQTRTNGGLHRASHDAMLGIGHGTNPVGHVVHGPHSAQLGEGLENA